MGSHSFFCRIPILLVFICFSSLFGAPPFSGTIFVDPDIVKPTDPTTYIGLEYSGRGQRTMYDRRSGWVSRNAYLFDARFDDGYLVEVQVNPEFGSVAAAQSAAEKYIPAIGQLPTVLRVDLKTVWIHKGIHPFGGGNNNILIHTGQAENYVRSGILEETLIHEASHTSLDSYHAKAPGWIQAQQRDPEFISTYARDNPQREDIAETFLLYLAVEYKRDRISKSLENTIRSAVPNRLAYFKDLDLNCYPIITPDIRISVSHYSKEKNEMLIEWNSFIGHHYQLQKSHNLDSWQSVGPPIHSESTATQSTIKVSELPRSAYFRVIHVSP